MSLDVSVQTSKASAKLASQEVEQLLRLQKNILEAVALGSRTQFVLDLLCTSAEAMVADSLASIMLYSEDRSCLNVAAAPSAPADVIELLNGMVPGEQSGSCGTAVFAEAPVIVCNTLHDIRWSNLKSIAEQTGIRACWSLPVRISNGDVIGSFALSSLEERKPTPFQYHLLETGASLAGICIQRQREEALLHKAAYHDALTGLPNRSLFSDQFERALSRAQRNSSCMALMFIDLDQFKNINDTRGHETGDRILQLVAESMVKHTRKADLVARFGGDEFILLIDDIHDVHEISLIAEKMLAAVAEPIKLDHHEYALTASIGISLFPGDGASQDVLLQRADTAMYEAKARGRNGYCFYEPALTEMVDKRLALESALRQAVKLHQMVIHYQPIYCAVSGEIDAVEALVRWDSPTLGLVSPAEFIPVAEETGIIKSLGRQVLETACRQCVDWWNTGLPTFRLAVNLSAGQLDGCFAERLKQLLTETGFPAGQLEIEVTESMIMRSPELAIGELDNIRKLNVGVSMDDFGTGHSSLAQLKRLPISRLKIDRSFVRDIPGDVSDRIIARTIIAMGQSLDLKVVAEGVETREQQDFLVEEGCDFLQGYLLNKPMPAENLQKLLAELKWSKVSSIER